MDVNSGGHMNIQDVNIMGFKVPGISINRSTSLQKGTTKEVPAWNHQ